MTSPPPPPESPEPDEAPTAESAPVADPATPSAGESQPGVHQPPAPQYVPPYAYQPFVPKLREPWFNPAKRGVLAAAAIVAAIVLLGGGFLIGAAVGSHHDRARPLMQMVPSHRIGYGMPGFRPGFRYRYYGPAGVPGRVAPGMHVVPGGRIVPPQAPSPAPSSSTSHR